MVLEVQYLFYVFSSQRKWKRIYSIQIKSAVPKQNVNINRYKNLSRNFIQEKQKYSFWQRILNFDGILTKRFFFSLYCPNKEILNKCLWGTLNISSSQKTILTNEVILLFPLKSRSKNYNYNNKTSSQNLQASTSMQNHQSIDSLVQRPDLWSIMDSFYYPFLSPYYFSLSMDKSEGALTGNQYSVKVEQGERKAQGERVNPSTEIENIPLIKEQEKQQKRKANKPNIVVKDRNILSNNTNLILSLIRRPSKSEKYVTKIISQLNTEIRAEYNSKRFYSYQNFIKQNVNDYRNKNAIQVIISHCDLACEIFTIPQQLFYNQVCRVLIHHYLFNNLLLDVLILKKIKKTSRADHLKVQRYLNNVLKGAKAFDHCNMYKL